MESLKEKIELYYSGAMPVDKAVVEESLRLLDLGKIRVAEKAVDGWFVNDWIKKSILLYFRIQNVNPESMGFLSCADKIPVKKWSGNEGVRVVPLSIARYGSFLSKGVVLMPSFVNIGAYVDEDSMVDTWTTVGSCAQIGKNVHLSGGVGIGGVLEPMQARPVIIEDDAFIGSNSIIVEGVHIGAGAVIGAGVVITGSTRIIDVTGSKEKILRGHVPANSIVIPGTSEKEFPAGRYGIPSALIIGKRSASTDKKLSLNQVLHDYEVSV